MDSRVDSQIDSGVTLEKLEACNNEKQYFYRLFEDLIRRNISSCILSSGLTVMKNNQFLDDFTPCDVYWMFRMCKNNNCLDYLGPSLQKALKNSIKNFWTLEWTLECPWSG